MSFRICHSGCSSSALDMKLPTLQPASGADRLAWRQHPGKRMPHMLQVPSPQSPHTPVHGVNISLTSKSGAYCSRRQWSYRHGAAHAIACFWARQICGSSEEASQPRAFEAQQVTPRPQIHQGCEHGFMQAAVLAGLHCLQHRRPSTKQGSGGPAVHGTNDTICLQHPGRSQVPALDG